MNIYNLFQFNEAAVFLLYPCVCQRAAMRTRAQSRRGRSDSYRRPRGAKNFFFFFFPEEKSALVCCISCKRRKLCVILDYKSQQRRIEVGGVAGGESWFVCHTRPSWISDDVWGTHVGSFFHTQPKKKVALEGERTCSSFLLILFKETVERVFSKPFDFFFVGREQGRVVKKRRISFLLYTRIPIIERVI